MIFLFENRSFHQDRGSAHGSHTQTENPRKKRRKEEERNPKKNEKTLGTAKQAELGVAAGDAVLSQYGSVLMLSTMFA